MSYGPRWRSTPTIFHPPLVKNPIRRRDQFAHDGSVTYSWIVWLTFCYLVFRTVKLHWAVAWSSNS